MLNSCMGLYGTRSTYGSQSAAAVVNEAKVSMVVKPEGTRGGAYSFSAMVVGVGVANLDGPFRWRIEAEGIEGKHEAMFVQNLRTETETTKRSEPYPRKWLGARVDFVKRKIDPPGVVKAVFNVPGLLQVKPKEDGPLNVFADVIIVKQGKRERSVVKFRLDPTKKSDNQILFIPAVIVKSFGKGPADWEDDGWDR